MRFFLSVGLGASCGFLLASVVRESARLFHLEEVMMETHRYVITALNTTRGKWALRSRPLPPQASDADPPVTYVWPLSCTPDQLDMIYQRLPEFGENCGNQGGPCPISLLTRCPHASWLENYSASQHEQQATKKSFLAINVGCNKGYDAVKLLRMGSNNPAITRIAWKEVMPDSQPGICAQENELSTPLTSPSSSEEGTETSVLVYCIEPMPSTFLALQNAANTTGWDNQLKIVHLALNNEDPSTVLFPKPAPENQGTQAVEISNDCSERPDECIQVESSRLDFMITKEQLNDKRVNALIIDVEGFDFDVLQGGNATLRNTEYVEFGFHEVGKWGSEFKLGNKPLKVAIDVLDELGFTCYWAGHGELWRITGCWQPHYVGAFQSNVACANRQLAPSLLQTMETVFLGTVSTPVYPKTPIDVSAFLALNRYRYDTISLLDVDGNERYQLVVVDRALGRSPEITYSTCVWLNPPSEPQPDRRGELQAAAERNGCARIIAVDRKPPEVGDDIVESELHHVVRVIAQTGFFLGDMMNALFKDVHFFSESGR